MWHILCETHQSSLAKNFTVKQINISWHLLSKGKNFSSVVILGELNQRRENINNGPPLSTMTTVVHQNYTSDSPSLVRFLGSSLENACLLFDLEGACSFKCSLTKAYIWCNRQYKIVRSPLHCLNTPVHTFHVSSIGLQITSALQFNS